MRNATETTRLCNVCRQTKLRDAFAEREYRLPRGGLATRFVGPCRDCYASGKYWALKEERKCNVCLVSKPADEFYRHSYTTRTGKASTRFMSKCKACHLGGLNVPPGMTRTPDTRERIEKKRAYNARKRGERHRQYERLRTEDPDGLERIRRARHIKDKYGITIEEYRGLLEAQNGKCKTCDCRHVANGNGRQRLYIDHDHITGKVRGLLCHWCNASMGLVGDDPARLRRLADYLEAHAT